MVEYLKDLVVEIDGRVVVLESSKEFKAIYKNSLAAFVSLKALARRQIPLGSSAAELSRRLPVLVACGQIVQAFGELRRFIELITWWPYFVDHPVEWEHFAANPGLGYVKYDANPIAFGAHREISYYFAYITERGGGTPSSVLRKCVRDLQVGYAEASKFVHAGGLIDPNAKLAAFDDTTHTVLRSYGSSQRAILRAGVVVGAWLNMNGLHQMPAVERSWFDWLVGRDATHALRDGSVAT